MSSTRHPLAGRACSTIASDRLHLRPELTQQLQVASQVEGALIAKVHGNLLLSVASVAATRQEVVAMAVMFIHCIRRRPEKCERSHWTLHHPRLHQASTSDGVCPTQPSWSSRRAHPTHHDGTAQYDLSAVGSSYTLQTRVKTSRCMRSTHFLTDACDTIELDPICEILLLRSDTGRQAERPDR